MIINNKNDSIELKNIKDLPSIEMVEDPQSASVIFCSVVTTSLNKNMGDLLRINLKLCYINKDGKFSKARKVVSFFEDPKRELTNEESRFLDFSIEDKANSSIDWNLISGLFEKADLIVAHNAAFVKPWIEKYISQSSTLWACSMDQVDWAEKDFPSRSLSVLSVFSGFFYNFQDSSTALEAVTHVLDKNVATSSLIAKARTPDLQVFAANAPRELNHLLKERRYRWNPDLGCWWLGLKDPAHGDNESAWLVENLPGTEPQIFEIDPKFRFSE